MEDLILNFTTDDATEVLEEVARARLKNAILKALEESGADWDTVAVDLFPNLGGLDPIDVLATRITAALADGLDVRVDGAPVGTVPMFEDDPLSW
jgi:hypothetical protein